ncbi:hypothetical protein COY62_03105 [bacterium (Candidatus Howlettbacteria) CG_4_10_14_0_8_um_filter_40_9]|nr:MAG: hypothetical protein COY62_03105 [bacterium (Candidatus Howlettbacteria) CG_4_10_14_0_8_um_filter_40_9]
MFFLFIFILGLLFGSFLNVVIFWLESNAGEDEEIKLGAKNFRKHLGGRSFCPSCKHQLNSKDLIPVISWVFLKARCRFCKEKISVQYPLVELFTGLIFLTTFLYFRSEIFSAISYWLLAVGITKLVLLLTVNCLLLIVFVYDLKHKIIPDKIIYPAIVLALSYWLLAIGANYLYGNISLASSLYPLLSAFGVGGFFYFLATVSDGKWMGGGDIKLVFLMGLLLGFPNILPAMFIGFISGAVVGVVLIILGKKKLQSEIPFGPFLIAGTWITLFWGDKVVEWYLRAFL